MSVVALKESAELVAVPGIVRGAQVQDDLRRSLLVSRQKHHNKQVFDSPLMSDDLLVATVGIGATGVSSRRLSVLLPAKALPQSRCCKRSSPAGGIRPSFRYALFSRGRLLHEQLDVLDKHLMP